LAQADTLADAVETADVLIRDAVGAQAAAWGTIDPATMLSTSCVLCGELDHGLGALPPHVIERERRLFELEWADDEPNTFWQLVRTGRTAAALRLDVGDPTRLARYRELLMPLAINDELRLLLDIDGRSWGTAIFYRSVPEPFNGADVERARECGPVVAAALRRAMLRAVCDSPQLPSPPGALVVDQHDVAVVSSTAAEGLLDSLDDAQAATTLTSLAASTRARGASSITVTGPGGVVTLHGSPAKGIDGGVAVVVERPRSIELAPLIMHAVGFTPRERAAAELLLAGRSRTQIARLLDVSTNTVGDHLRQVYRKAGVASRGELAAFLYGRYYEQPRAEQVPPSPYGYFVGR
jgi:DNA-binding CsgD family transcriptional regulator